MEPSSASNPADTAIAGPSRPPQIPAQRKKTHTSITNYAKLLEERVTIIKEGDVVMLQLPSEAIKVVTVSGSGITSLGKFGSFPTSQLIGRHYDITYEITPSNPASSSSLPSSSRNSPAPQDETELNGDDGGNKKGGGGKKGKGGKARGKGKNGGIPGEEKSAAGNILRPRKKARIQELDADVIGILNEIEETDATNELIDDNPSLNYPPVPPSLDPNSPSTSTSQQFQGILTPSEIAHYRSQGMSGEEMIQMQMDRHERFGLKTEFSKEKWKKRKEKKYGSFVTPLAPTLANIIAYHLTRTPISILSLRIDTLSQILSHAFIRPGGRYLVVEDTSGLLVASILERMGGHGSILVLTDNDSPPGWPVLEGMNFDKDMLERSVKYLNWYQAEESYRHVVKENLPRAEIEEVWIPQVDNPAERTAAQQALMTARSKAMHKERMKERKRILQEAVLDETRDELHRGNWDGLISASSISPPSILARLTPYLSGSATVTIYSQFAAICSETLQYMRDRPEYLAPSMTESWMRKYQVLPMRTHPMMVTSATGGYLVHATRVHPSAPRTFAPRRQKRKADEGDADLEGRVEKKQKQTGDEAREAGKATGNAEEAGKDGDMEEDGLTNTGEAREGYVPIEN